MCSSRWTRYDWALNEMSRANDMNEFIDRIKVRSYGKSRRNKARKGNNSARCGVNRGRVAGVVASSAV